MEMFDDGEWTYSPEPRPVWGCKHCDFTMPYSGGDDPEGEYLALGLECIDPTVEVGDGGLGPAHYLAEPGYDGIDDPEGVR